MFAGEKRRSIRTWTRLELVLAVPSSDSRMSDTTDISLLQRLKNSREKEAWNRFVELYAPLIRGWAHRLEAFGADRDELTQEVFTVLVRAIPAFQYEIGGRFRGWLWTITKNKWRELLRKRTPENRADVEVEAPPVDDPIEAIDAAEYRRYLVGRAMALMRDEFQPNTWRAFLEMTMEDHPANTVAQRLGMSVDAVYAAKSRVLRRLRQELDGLAEWD